MADFVDSFPDAVLLDLLGDSITLVTEGGLVTTAKAVLEFDVLIDEYSTERINTLELLVGDFASPLQRGDKVVHNSNNYILDSLISADQNYQTWGLING